MEIKRKDVTKETLEAGDVVEWTSGDDKIIAIVTCITNDYSICSVTIYDNRSTAKTYTKPHIVFFGGDTNLTLRMKGSEVEDNFDNLEIA